jgi:4'-phosphopantetheinyl transferase
MFTRLGLFDGKPDSRRAALLDFCAEALSLARPRLCLAHESRGAPLLLVDGARGEWTVSSSSREDVFLFGLARGERIGVDVEIVRPLDPPDAALHPQERARLAAMSDAARLAAFYEIWTAKEAYVKALGAGLRRDPALIDVAAGAPLAIADSGRSVALAVARQWRERFAGKPAICAALQLAPAKASTC